MGRLRRSSDQREDFQAIVDNVLLRAVVHNKRVAAPLRVMRSWERRSFFQVVVGRWPNPRTAANYAISRGPNGAVGGFRKALQGGFFRPPPFGARSALLEAGRHSGPTGARRARAGMRAGSICVGDYEASDRLDAQALAEAPRGTFGKRTRRRSRDVIVQLANSDFWVPVGLLLGCGCGKKRVHGGQEGGAWSEAGEGGGHLTVCNRVKVAEAT